MHLTEAHFIAALGKHIKEHCPIWKKLMGSNLCIIKMISRLPETVIWNLTWILYLLNYFAQWQLIG
jgi:hypothetical protein